MPLGVIRSMDNVEKAVRWFDNTIILCTVFILYCKLTELLICGWLHIVGAWCAFVINMG